jgi:6-phosphogluconolactonase
VGARIRGPVPREGRAALADALKVEARVLPTPEDVARAGAEQFRETAADAIARRGVFRVALSGGSTPRRLNALLAGDMRKSIDWKKIVFFFGDERCVPPDSDRSNYRMAKETLFEPLRIPAERVHRIRGEADPKNAAADYEKALAKAFPRQSVPRFDLVFLGMGPDGHTASLFPGTRALASRKAVAANWVPAQSEWRVTLTFPTLDAARRVVFLVGGAEKVGPATAILTRSRGYRRFPAGRVQPKRGELLWLLDEEAGGRL